MLSRLFRKGRSGTRKRVSQQLTCEASSKSSADFQKITFCNISLNGLSFLIKSDDFQVNDTIEIKVSKTNGAQFSLSGKIVGQDVMYFSPNKDLRKSFFRYSVELDSKLSQQRLQDIAQEIEAS